jgi:CRISPR/Cas system-associated exonuclease Cas4 (RecB family)
VKTEDYAPQLALYALAMEKAFGKRPTAAWLHFLRHDAIEDIPLDAPALDSARRLIGRLRTAQDTLTFNLNEGDRCHSCPFYRSMCPAA